MTDDLVDFDGPFGGVQRPPPHLRFAACAASGTRLGALQQGDLLGGEILANVLEDDLGDAGAGGLDAGKGGLLAGNVAGRQIDVPLFCQLGEGRNIFGRAETLKHVTFILEHRGATNGENTEPQP